MPSTATPASKRRDAHSIGQTAWRYRRTLTCSPVRPSLPPVPSSTHSYRTRRILHLLYIGFAINWCVLGKDYGIRAMKDRGYNPILLRDATTGVEFPDTLDTLQATELAVREVEQQHGFTASNRDFLTACRAVVSARRLQRSAGEAE